MMNIGEVENSNWKLNGSHYIASDDDDDDDGLSDSSNRRVVETWDETTYFPAERVLSETTPCGQNCSLMRLFKNVGCLVAMLSC